MSNQGVINLYINDLANTTHQLYEKTAQVDDLTAENTQLSSENVTLKQEISELQAKYDALKSAAGDATPVVEGQIVEPAQTVPASPHF